jgi:uncharacterized protein (TIGR04222 family)
METLWIDMLVFLAEQPYIAVGILLFLFLMARILVVIADSRPAPTDIAPEMLAWLRNDEKGLQRYLLFELAAYGHLPYKIDAPDMPGLQQKSLDSLRTRIKQLALTHSLDNKIFSVLSKDSQYRAHYAAFYEKMRTLGLVRDRARRKAALYLVWCSFFLFTYWLLQIQLGMIAIVFGIVLLPVTMKYLAVRTPLGRRVLAQAQERLLSQKRYCEQHKKVPDGADYLLLSAVFGFSLLIQLSHEYEGAHFYVEFSQEFAADDSSSDSAGGDGGSGGDGGGDGGGGGGGD